MLYNSLRTNTSPHDINNISRYQYPFTLLLNRMNIKFLHKVMSTQKQLADKFI